MTARQCTGYPEENRQKDVFAQKDIQRAPIPGNAEHTTHTHEDAENLGEGEFFLEQQDAGQRQENGLRRLCHNVAVGSTVGDRVVFS